MLKMILKILMQFIPHKHRWEPNSFWTERCTVCESVRKRPTAPPKPKAHRGITKRYRG